MAKSSSKVGRLGLVLLGLASVLPSVMAIENNQKYCSKMNTATGVGTPSIWQSNGLCQKQCIGTHAFAVLNDNLCWCSDYIPGTTEDRDDCDFPCKGYDVEACGGTDLYGYIRLNLPPKGTKGAPSSTSKKPEAPTTVTAPGTTITELVTPTPSSTWTSSTSSSSSESSTTPTSSKTSTSSSTTSSSFSTSESTEALATVTESGEERIVTVIPTPASPIETGKKSTDKDSDGGGSSKLSTGAAVGLTVGLVALASIVAILLFFFMRKRKRDRDSEALRSGSPAVLNSGPPSRTMSEHSRYMLGTDGRHVVGNFQDDMNQPGNRRSRLMPVDPRLDPYAVGGVYARGDGTHSRESVMSIRDDRDYSRKVTGGVVPGAAQSPPRRVLGVANPDRD